MEPNAPFDFNMLANMTDRELQQVFGIRDHYVYGVSTTALGAAGTATLNFTTQVDSNFLWQGGVAQCDTTGTPTGTPLITVQIVDSSSGRNLNSAAVPLPFLFGTGQLPFLLPTPRFFRGGTQVTVNLTNYSTGTTYTNVYIGFVGTKFFKFAQQI